MPKISDLPVLSSPANDDETAVVDDSAATTKKLTLSALLTWIRSNLIPRNPYCFRAYASGATTIADNSATKVLFATENYDSNNNFSGSTYTAPVDGVYHFNGVVDWAGAIASGTNSLLIIYVNGSEAFRGPAMGAAHANSSSIGIGGDYALTAGQTVDLYCYQDSAGTEATATGSNRTWFSGFLVHAF